jgi:hypothetical protein
VDASPSDIVRGYHVHAVRSSHSSSILQINKQTKHVLRAVPLLGCGLIEHVLRAVPLLGCGLIEHVLRTVS